MITVHIIALLIGCGLDLLCGDPYWMPHPVRMIGKMISQLECAMIGPKGNEKENLTEKQKRRAGFWLVVIVCTVTGFIASVFLFASYRINVIAGVAVEAIMTYQILALTCLRVESMKVYRCLQEHDLEKARYAVSMIVGRDTQNLDEAGIAKAAIETVAENTSDGVIAPLLFTALGGPVLGFLYKAVNTMDSMIAYKNTRYLEFGRTAAKLDDICNFIPSRLSGYLMVASSALLGKEYSAKEAYRIFKRDRRNHASPNSAQTEAPCAGALGIQLAGDASYFGKIVKKPKIGDDKRAVVFEDIKRVNKMMYVSAFLCLLLMLLFLVSCQMLCA